MTKMTSNEIAETDAPALKWESLDFGARNRLVELISSGMPTVMMADFLGVQPNELQQLLECNELKQLIAKREAEERLMSMNSASQWDAVENIALKNVLAELKSRPDPEYSLRAAMVANKAIRQHKNQGVNVVEKLAEGGKTITLQLSQNVVNQLQQTVQQTVQQTQVNVQLPQHDMKMQEQKILDVFTAKDMERLTEQRNGGREYEAFFEEVTTLSKQPNAANAEAGSNVWLDEVDKLIDSSASSAVTNTK